MRVQHISKHIHHKPILADIDFSVEPGSIIGIVGRNGSGKTTLLRSLAGILTPTRGSVYIDGIDIFKHPEIKKQIIFVPDSTEALKNYSTKELIYLYKNIYPEFDTSYLFSLMKRFKLSQISKIGNYSKGQKALFTLITAFATGASYILLDEPTDGLDVIVKKQVLQLLVEEVSDRRLAVLISSHRLDELEFMVNEVIFIKQGKVDSHYELDTMKNQYKKIQLAFAEKMPEALENEIEILDKTGKVYTVLIPRGNSLLEEKISDSRPLFYEELPMSLEDYFVAKLGGPDDV
ncbi:MAG: ABC transporter ATP-binding protein [Alkalicoccus sp.]|nr:MAG: ABC transporter ATP-binding protein [Alkalicoccus sp.]